MAGWTNKGKYRALERIYQGGSIPASYYVMLTRSTASPDTDLASSLTQIASGNGYTDGGSQIVPDSTNFDVLTEDDGNDRALIQLADLVWTASGGPIPSDSVGAQELVMTSDVASAPTREVLHYWQLGGSQVVSDTQSLTIQNAEIRINET